MEDMFQVLLTVAFIVIGIVSQWKKGKNEDAPDVPEMSLPDDFDPLMECSDEAIPTVDMPPQPVQQPSRPQRKKPERQRKPHTATTPPPTPANTTTREADDYSLHDVDDVRRAIIWSEILQRKY